MRPIYKIDIGGRDEQQDSCEVFYKSYSTFLVLGDGMGGHKGGAKASKTLVEYAKLAYDSEVRNIAHPKAFFQSIVNHTMEALKSYREDHTDTDPQTTCVLVLIQDNMVYSMHIGDSRVYILDDGKYQWRTKDHSVVQMLLNLGEITEDEMATHPDQNRLLKSLNSKKEVDGTFKVTPLPNGKSIVLVCSDGFWEYISVKEMRKYSFKMDIDKALSQMVSLAKQRGGVDGDNISVAVSMQETQKKIKTSTIAIKTKLITIIGLLLLIILSLLSIKYLPLEDTKEKNITQATIINHKLEDNKTKTSPKEILKEANQSKIEDKDMY